MAWAIVVATGCSSLAPAADPLARTDRDLAAPRDDVAPPPVLYPGDRTLSPITADLAARLRAVILAGGGRADVVAKIGDSHSSSRDYLACLGGNHVRLAGHAYLAPTIDWFRAPVAGGSSWTRTSLAAANGWPASRALGGTPSPIDRELAMIEPAFATVMFGTNDIGYAHIDRYGRNMLDIVDLLLARGVVPIVSSIPARGDDRAADAWVPPYNAVARAVAQARQIPFIDVHRDLQALRGKGLHKDRIHLRSNLTGCTFGDDGLRRAGQNRRNLLTLEMLDALRRAVIAGEPAPDAEAPRLEGAGTAADPYVIPSLPFGDARDATSRADDRGPEIYYRLDATAPTRLRGYVIDRAGVDHELRLLDGTPEASAPIDRGDLAVDTVVAPGTYFLVVDTRGEQTGEYLLAVTD